MKRKNKPVQKQLYNPLKKVEYDEGRFVPVMFNLEEELTAREYSLIAKSHGYELDIYVVDISEEMKSDTFTNILKEINPPEKLNTGFSLISAWDNDHDEVVFTYARKIGE